MARTGSPAARMRAAMAAATLLAFGVLAGCGQETPVPGEKEPKRTLEPRTEALRFFPADTPAVVLIGTLDPAGLDSLARSMSPSALWREAQARVTDALERGGIDPEMILELSREPGLDPELPPPEIAAGTVPGAGPSSERMLFVLPTEQGVALDTAFKESAESERMESAGEFDGALLYRAPDMAFAVRDGVLIGADNINRVQQAIARRDGGREAQLDDAAVNALLNQLPESDPLHAYLVAPEASRMVKQLLAPALPLAIAPRAVQIAEIAISAAGGGDSELSIELVANLSESPEIEEEPEDGVPERPALVIYTASDLREALGGRESGALLDGVPPEAPVTGAVWIDGSQIRARLRLTPLA